MSRYKLICRPYRYRSYIQSDRLEIDISPTSTSTSHLPLRPLGASHRQMRCRAKQLSLAWPPLPPEPGLPGASQLPGYGALCSVAVEPHEGRVPPHGTVTLRVTLRAVHECDLQAQLFVDLPFDENSTEPAAPPLKALGRLREVERHALLKRRKSTYRLWECLHMRFVCDMP